MRGVDTVEALKESLRQVDRSADRMMDFRLQVMSFHASAIMEPASERFVHEFLLDEGTVVYAIENPRL